MSNNEVKKRSNTEFSSRFDGFSTSSLEIPCSILDIRFRFPSFFSPFSTADGSKKWECLEAETCPVFYGLGAAYQYVFGGFRGGRAQSFALMPGLRTAVIMAVKLFVQTQSFIMHRHHSHCNILIPATFIDIDSSRSWKEKS